jgi:hypothetical protein
MLWRRGGRGGEADVGGGGGRRGRGHDGGRRRHRRRRVVVIAIWGWFAGLDSSRMCLGFMEAWVVVHWARPKALYDYLDV